MSLFAVPIICLQTLFSGFHRHACILEIDVLAPGVFSMSRIFKGCVRFYCVFQGGLSSCPHASCPSKQSPAWQAGREALQRCPSWTERAWYKWEEIQSPCVLCPAHGSGLLSVLRTGRCPGTGSQSPPCPRPWESPLSIGWKRC